MENKTLFEETHYNKPLIILFLLVIFMFAIIFIINWGSEGKQLTGLDLSIILLLVVLVLSLFNKININVFSKKMVISFGVGIIKKTFLLEDIDITNIEKKKIPWYYGSGIRYIKGGILYNVKSGEAISFKLKNNKRYFIVIDRYNQLLDTLTGRVLDRL